MKKITFLFGFFILSFAALAQQATVMLTVNANNFQPLQTVIFDANISGSNIANVVLIGSDGMAQADDAAPYQWIFNLPNTVSGQNSFKVVVLVDGQVIESNEQVIAIKPVLSSIQSLSFEPGSTIFLFPGTSEQLRLVGLFTDGFERDLTQAAMETVYSENIVNGLAVTAGDSPVITISADGRVTETGVGSADVVATNNGKATIQRIFVEAVEDDVAGLTDVQEQAIGTDPYNQE